MIAKNGREIPDPPRDPEMRRLWKYRYYSDLYGLTDEEVRAIMNYQPPKPRQFPPWLEFVAYRICFPIGVIASVVYLAAHFFGTK